MPRATEVYCGKTARMPAGAMSGRQLLEFLEERMQPSSYYQPLVIGSLAEAGGSMSQEDLAKRLLLEDHFAVGRAVKTLMRWPKTTLQKHGIVRYYRDQREFELLVAFEDEETRHSVISMCDEMVAGWRKRESKRVASRFYAVIEAADGRCQACGSPGSERPLDVDHIVPRSQSKNGCVKRDDGTWVPVDDFSNLGAVLTMQPRQARYIGGRLPAVCWSASGNGARCARAWRRARLPEGRHTAGGHRDY